MAKSRRCAFILLLIAMAISISGVIIPGSFQSFQPVAFIIWLTVASFLFFNWLQKLQVFQTTHTAAALLFRELFETAPDAMIAVNEAGSIVMVNNQTAKLFGYAGNELINQPVEILIPASLRFVHEQHVKNYGHAPKVRYMGAGLELEALKKNGTTFPVEISLSPVNAGDKRLFAVSVRDITERKIAETALKKSEKNFQLLVGGVKEYAIFLLDKEGKIASWNEGAALIKGYTAEEVIGKRIDIFYTPKELEENEPVINLTTAREKGHFEKEGWRKRKDGAVFFANVVITALYDDNGAFYGYAKITKDITEKRRVQEQLENLHRQIELTNDGIYILNADRLITSWNRGAELIYGFTSQEAIGKNSNELLETDLSPEAIQEALARLNEEGYWRSVLKRKRKDGREIYVRTSNTVIRNAQHDITGYVAVNIDITKQVQLRKQVDHLASIVENSSEAVFSRDKEHRILSWNRGAEKMFGYSKEEVLGKTTVEIGFLPFSMADIKKVEQQIISDNHWEAEVYYKAKDGTGFFGAVTGNCTRNDNGDIASFTFMVKDITARKRLEDFLKNANEQLEAKVEERTFELYKSEKRFRALIEHNNDMIAMVDADFKVVYLSPSCDRITGWSREELVRRSVIKLLHPEDKLRANEAFMQIMANPGKAVALSLRILQKGDYYLWLQGTAVNMLHDEALQSIVFNLRDVTETINAQKKLERNERRFRSLIENSADAFTLFDKDLKIVYRSASALRITGWNGDEPALSNVLANLHADDQERAAMVMQEMLQKPDEVFQVSIRYLHKNGHYLHVEGALVNKLTDEDIRAVVFNFRDVTDRVMAEQKLVSNEKRFRSLIENSHEFIGLLDESFQLVYRSPTAEKITGWSNEELSSVISGNLHPDDKQAFIDAILAVRETPGKSLNILVRTLHKNGHYIWLDAVITNLLENPDVRGLLFNIRDVSEKIKAEEKIHASEIRFRSLIEHSAEGISLIDEQMRVLYRSPTGERMLAGSDPKTTMMHVFPDDLEKIRMAFTQAMAKPAQPAAFLVRYMLPDESFYWMEGTFTNLLHVEGVNAVVTNYRDVSDKVIATQEIVKERDFSESIINSLPAIFFIHRPGGAIIRWNRNLEDVTGFDAAELMLMTPTDLFAVEDRGYIKEKMAEVMRNGHASAQRNLLTKEHKRIPYFFSVTTISYLNEQCPVVVAVDFTERLLIQNEIEQTTEKLRQLTAHLQSVREEERKRIGREIHDELGQQLTAIKMDIAWIDRKTTDASPVKGKIKNIIQLLDQSNRSVRRILNELRSNILDMYGIVDALDWLGNQFTTLTKVKLTFHKPATTINTTEAVTTCLFRIYQEALNNIAKYAKAKHVVTWLTDENGTITLTVSDDGVGFEHNQMPANDKFGMLGMRERVLSLGGEFIVKLPGKGVTIKAILPNIVQPV
ncbi:PAS domain S-box protein [Panacibacter sp. DH6]|uniref:PAS domain S-box protein n=1 Tax=Panacibacter microcysteis TaxID=2793269 RepID=A0A931GVE5_9BACT|nr:PAS domain S-box protein [Panacibacter microcysteis]MBG9377726.1 PAS domain S-box protein [Panacibacter microcysteis]